MSLQGQVGVRFEPVYEMYSTKDGDQEPAGKPFKVPFGVMMWAGFGAARTAGTDFYFLIDQSKSMSWAPGGDWGTPSRMDAVTETLGQLATDLGLNDRVAVFMFNDQVTPVANGELRPAAEFAALVKNLPAPAGATDIAGGFRAVARAAGARGAAGRPAVCVLLTDGKADMGPTPKVNPADDARAATADLTAAGVDLAVLGFGSDWDPELLLDLDTRVGGHGVRYIDGRGKGRGAFQAVVAGQHEAVFAHVVVEADLNVEHFAWESVWRRLPTPSAGSPVLTTVPPGRVSEPGAVPARTGRWVYPLGNVHSLTKSAYGVLLTARPAKALAPGRYVAGRFLLRSGTTALMAAPTTVVVEVTAASITGSVSSPQNPSPDAEHEWYLALAFDKKRKANSLVSAGRKEEAAAAWDDAIRLLDLGGDKDGAAAEQDELAVYRAAHALTAAQAVDVGLRSTERTSTVTTPVSSGRATPGLDRGQAFDINDDVATVAPLPEVRPTGAVMKRFTNKRVPGVHAQVKDYAAKNEFGGRKPGGRG